MNPCVVYVTAPLDFFVLIVNLSVCSQGVFRIQVFTGSR